MQVKKEICSPAKPVRKALKESQASKKDSYTQEMDQPPQVKKEKITNILPRESIENMPPPPDGMILKKNIKTENNNVRSTRTRTRKQKELQEQREERKDSDVMIQNTTIVTIDLSSDDDKPETTQRSTRTKTRAAQKKAETSAESNKRSRSPSEDSNKSKSTRTKKTKKKKADEPERSVYEDALCETPLQLEQVVNTVNNDLNVTHVKEDNILKDIMTDDESPVAPQNKTIVLTKSTKQLFSPFDHSPVKKKVEAFEKLGATAAAAAAGTPVLTRKATKTLAKEKKEVGILFFYIFLVI